MASYKLYIKVFLLCFCFKLICGEDIASRLMKRYNDVRSKCIDKHKHKRPAYECTGLLVRGVANGGAGQKHAWSKRDLNKKTNAFSFGFLRKDQLFNKFPGGYDSGFIIYPHLKTPKGKNKYEVLCAFPVNSHTDDRVGKHACGKSRSDPSGESGHCSDHGIKTLEKWISHFDKIMRSSNKDFIRRQCGFDTTTKHAARNFAVALGANRYLRGHSRYAWQNNELRIRGWKHDNAKKLPIEAFFYLIGTPAGEQNAKKYQSDFLAATGEKIPVVGIRLPQPNDEKIIIKV